jgi:predicted P-loop ATPase
MEVVQRVHATEKTANQSQSQAEREQTETQIVDQREYEAHSWTEIQNLVFYRLSLGNPAREHSMTKSVGGKVVWESGHQRETSMSVRAAT